MQYMGSSASTSGAAGGHVAVAHHGGGGGGSDANIAPTPLVIKASAPPGSKQDVLHQLLLTTAVAAAEPDVVFGRAGLGLGVAEPVGEGYVSEDCLSVIDECGSGSVSSGSAKSVSTLRSESRLDESLSSSSFPGSPNAFETGNGNGAVGAMAMPQIQQKSSRTKSSRSRTESEIRRGSAVAAAAGGADGSELPRLIGTKSQASTASSSATRDSGISLSDHNRRAAGGGTAARRSSSNGRAGPPPLHHQISVDDLLPVNGHAVSLSNRTGTGGAGEAQKVNSGSANRAMSREDQMRTMSRLSSKYQARKGNARTDDPSPPRSPKYPSSSADSVISSASKAGMLMRPAKNSPFSSNPKNGGGGNGFVGLETNSNDSAAFSNASAVPSVPSSYEDDFTTDEDDEGQSIKYINNNKSNNRSAQSQRTISSSTSAGSLSRIPIKRNSSLRRKKQVMENYRQTAAQEADGGPPDLDQQLPTLSANGDAEERLNNGNRLPAAPSAGSPKKLPYSRSRPTNRSRSPSQKKQSVPQPQVRNGTLSRQQSQQRPSYLRKAPASKSLERAPLLPNKKRTSSNSSGGASRLAKTYSKSVGALNKQNQQQAVASPTTAAPEDIDEVEDPFKPRKSLANSPAIQRKSLANSPASPRRLSVANSPASPRRSRASSPARKLSVTPPTLAVEHSELVAEAGGATPSTTTATPATTTSSSTATTPKVPRKSPAPDGASSSTANRLSTAGSAVSVSTSNYAHVQLKTQVTLKSPYEGANLGPAPIKPGDFLTKCMEDMVASDWDVNVKGMTGVVRMVRHHSDHVVVEYKEVVKHIMNHVKNLRSQVCRAAVICMCEMFQHLRRNMEQDLEKIALPLINKTGDTNKFLREDCHLALDAMVENLSPARVVAVVTASDVLSHKSPTIRGTVARLLAYATERMGVAKAMSSPPHSGITEKLIPAVAKLAQDGSQDARSYAKYTLVMFMEQGGSAAEVDRVLRKNVTANTMRNLEKIMDALRQPARGGNGGRRATPGFGSTLSRGSSIRRGKSRQTL